ncbi:MAG: CDP-alcohol phosphatidyltransferase family protein, partial [archaeon]
MINLFMGILLWFAFIALLRIVSLIITYVKFNKVTILHTYGIKLTGFFLFILTFILTSMERNTGFLEVCLAATLSATKELAIHLYADDLVVNRKSLFNLALKK